MNRTPFAVNDIAFARETGFPQEKMNNYGCSLIWGHPQGPTGLRSVIELIEELAMRGGGVGLFGGCAAGNSGMSVVLRVGDKLAVSQDRCLTPMFGAHEEMIREMSGSTIAMEMIRG